MDRLQHLPQPRRWHFWGQHNQELGIAYLQHLQARPYAPATLQTTIDGLNRFCRLVPACRQPHRDQDLASPTADDVAAWRHAAHQAGRAPSTINTILQGRHRFLACLQDHGGMTQHPVTWRRHQVVMPQTLPQPRPEDDRRCWFRVLDRRRDRTMLLRRRRCGRRVGEVSPLPWPAINVGAGSLRLNHGPGQVDRVGYESTDVEPAWRHGRRCQPSEAPSLCPRARTHGLPRGVRASQPRMARDRHAAGSTTPEAPHALRPPVATPRLHAGAPLAGVKERMGHRSMRLMRRSTPRYETTTRQPYDQAMERIDTRQAILARGTMPTMPRASQPLRADGQRRHDSPPTLDSDPLELQVFLAASDHPLERLSFREGDRLIDAQQQPGGAPATLNRRVSALTHVFDCRNDHQLVGAPPVKPRHGWRRRRALPRALSTAPLAPLLAHIPPPMDTALLRLMWRGGWRGSEVAQLQRQDIDWSPPAGLVEQGKGRTERRVSLSAEAVARRRACVQQRPTGVAGDAVFGQQQRPRRALAVKAIPQNRARDANAAGIVARGPRWRPTLASHGLEPGAAIVSLREWWGQAAITSSARYAKASHQQVTPASRRTRQKVLQRSQV